MLKTIINVVIVSFISCLCWPQEHPMAIRGGQIFTGQGDIIEDGTIIFEKGKIISIGKDIPLPSNTEIIDADGLFVTPGYIDAYSHIGLDGMTEEFYGRGEEGQGALWDSENLINASRRVFPKLEEISESQWLRTGVTTTYVSPGPQNLAGGIGIIIKLTGKVVKETAAMSGSFGETALNAFETPTTRQGMISILRQTFVRAQEDALEGDDGPIFAQILSGSLPFRVVVNTPDDILTALRLADEFKLKLILDSVAGGHVVAESIANAGVPVVVGPSIINIGDGGSYETFAHTPANAAKLHKAGVRVALGTSAHGIWRSVAMEAVVAKAHGLPEAAALKAVTSEAASILGIADRTGTLAPKMDADIVIWEGRPISTWAIAKKVIVDGITQFER